MGLDGACTASEEFVQGPKLWRTQNRLRCGTSQVPFGVPAAPSTVPVSLLPWPGLCKEPSPAPPSHLAFKSPFRCRRAAPAHPDSVPPRFLLPSTGPSPWV